MNEMKTCAMEFQKDAFISLLGYLRRLCFAGEITLKGQE